jgi:hypothetical protein
MGGEFIRFGGGGRSFRLFRQCYGRANRIATGTQGRQREVGGPNLSWRHGGRHIEGILV